MSHRKYTQEEFIEAIQTSYSIAEALRKLGVEPFGGNYIVAKNYIKNLNLDTSHFTGQGWSKGRTTGPKRPIEDYLSNKYTIQTHKLKLRLIKENILPAHCDNCKNTKWLNNPIPLELHHINGNNQDNSLTNLQLLCPNCHALTDNYRGKNKSG